MHQKTVLVTEHVLERQTNKTARALSEMVSMTNGEAAQPEHKVEHQEMISSTLYNPRHTVPLCLHD